MDLNALRTRVRKLTGVQMETLLTPAELDQIINEAYLHIASLADWTFTQDQVETTIGTGDNTFAFPDPITLPFSAAVTSPSDRQGVLRPRRQEDFDRYPQWEAEATSGIPWAWAIRDNTTAEVFPAADQSVTLRVRGWVDVSELAADTDEPVFASQFHPVVSLDAARRVLTEEGDDSGRSQRYQAEATTFLMQMGRRYLLDDTDAAARMYVAAAGQADGGQPPVEEASR